MLRRGSARHCTAEAVDVELLGDLERKRLVPACVVVPRASPRAPRRSVCNPSAASIAICPLQTGTMRARGACAASHVPIRAASASVTRSILLSSTRSASASCRSTVSLMYLSRDRCSIVSASTTTMTPSISGSRQQCHRLHDGPGQRRRRWSRSRSGRCRPDPGAPCSAATRSLPKLQQMQPPAMLIRLSSRASIRSASTGRSPNSLTRNGERLRPSAWRSK